MDIVSVRDCYIWLNVGFIKLEEYFQIGESDQQLQRVMCDCFAMEMQKCKALTAALAHQGAFGHEKCCWMSQGEKIICRKKQ